LRRSSITIASDRLSKASSKVVKQDFAERGQRERVMVVKAGLTRDRREASERLAANRERG